ncbi:MAG: amino acid permease [Archangium sp.]|nr:amino acid permease [Archangium sp.]
MTAQRSLGVWSGVGLVIANMVGAGVFLSTGFMAQSMGPGTILLAWAVGAVLALSGARAYAEVARLVPHGGGEYRYLSTLWHSSLGYLAGWASLLVGFSAPIALDALAAGAFAHAVVPALDPKLVATVLVVGLTGLHAVGLTVSTQVQNALVAIKVLLLLAFVGVGVALGTLAWPSWQPADPSGESLSGFANSLFYIAFAFSGWNAAVYAADDFEDAPRQVPRAMLWGCAVVAVLYLVVNFIFVANLTPAEGSVVFGYDDFTSLKGEGAHVTLGQAVMARLAGPTAGTVMSAVMVVLFVSAMSAMTMVGPRVYAAMARDGFLPSRLAGNDGEAPRGAVVLQGVLALVVLYTHSLRSVLANVGAVLVVFAALTVSGLFVRKLRAVDAASTPSAGSLVAAAVYVGSAVMMVYFGFRSNPSMLAWVGAVAVVGLVAWGLTSSRRRKVAAP